jgi:2-keto-3-deoxygluconate permease
VLALLPLMIGVVLGNIDSEWRAFLRSGTQLMIPFFALALGTGIDLGKIASAGLAGIALGVAVIVVTGVVLIALDRLTGGSGLAGIAAASTAGNAAAVPVAVAAIYTLYQPIAAQATVQVSAAVIVTAVLTPIVTAWYSQTLAKRRRTPMKSLAA